MDKPHLFGKSKQLSRQLSMAIYLIGYNELMNSVFTINQHDLITSLNNLITDKSPLKDARLAQSLISMPIIYCGKLLESLMHGPIVLMHCKLQVIIPVAIINA